MATITDPRVETTSVEQRFLVQNIGWEGYEVLLGLIGDRVRITYAGGDLELMSPSFDHEQDKRMLGMIVQALIEELGVPGIGAASTTWRRKDLDRGLEADECFYLYSHAEQICGKTIDLKNDPPPDLAIEVETTRSALDRRAIYAKLGIPELWRYDGRALHVDLLTPDGSYTASETSRHFPFLALDEIVRLVHEGTAMLHSSWGRMVREWIRAEIVPRYQGAPEGML